MKYLLLVCALLMGCQGSNDLGACIGLGDPQDPNLVYDWSGQNIAVGIVFVETLFVPAIVVATDIKCPVARKETSNGK